MNYASPEAIKQLQATIDYYTIKPADEIWRIKWMGGWFKTQKGKTTWRKESHARAAFRNFLENSQVLYFLHRQLRPQNPNELHWQNNSVVGEFEQFVSEQVAAGYLAFVNIPQ